VVTDLNTQLLVIHFLNEGYKNGTLGKTRSRIYLAPFLVSETSQEFSVSIFASLQKLRKANISFVLSVGLAVSPHATTYFLLYLAQFFLE